MANLLNLPAYEGATPLKSIPLANDHIDAYLAAVERAELMPRPEPLYRFFAPTTLEDGVTQDSAAASISNFFAFSKAGLMLKADDLSYAEDGDGDGWIVIRTERA